MERSVHRYVLNKSLWAVLILGTAWVTVVVLGQVTSLPPTVLTLPFVFIVAVGGVLCIILRDRANSRRLRMEIAAEYERARRDHERLQLGSPQENRMMSNSIR